jgi:MFS family permease
MELLSPDSPLAVPLYVGLANAYGELKDHPQAVTYLNKALAIAPADAPQTKADIYTNLGHVYLEQKQYEQPIEYFRQALSLCSFDNPQRDAIYQGLIQCYKNGPSLLSPDQAPLRYFILNLFMFFNRDEFTIRFPAILFGVGCLYLVYQLGTLIFGVPTGLLSAFLLSLSLWHIHDSTRADMYSLFSFLTLGAILYFYKSLRRPSWFFLLAFTSFSVLCCYAFYPSIVFVVTLLFGYFLYRKKGEKTPPIFICFIVIFTFLLPAILSAFYGFQWKKDLESQAFQGYSWQYINQYLLSLFGGVIKIAPLNIGIFLLGLDTVLSHRENRKSGLFLLSCILIPSAFFLAVSIIFKMRLAARYFSPIYPLFIIIASYGITKLRRKSVAFLLILVFCSSLFFFIAHKIGFNTVCYIPPDYIRECRDFRFVANYVRSHYQEGDVVVVEHEGAIKAIQYYLDRKNAYPVLKVVPSCDGRWYYRYEGAKVKNFYGLTDSGPERLKKLWKEHKRLLLIYLTFYNPDKEFDDWVNNNYSQRIFFEGGAMYMFDNQQKKDLINAHDYKCGDKVCYLNCPVQTFKIIYPYQI